MDESVEGGIGKAMETVSDARGWIVDLRGNTGGGYEPSLKKLIGELEKPVGCIVDAGCVSAGETFARDLWNVCKARIYGGKTAGSSSSKRVFALPSGIASIRYSVRSRGGIGGKPIEFHGIEPHVPLEAIPEWVADGKNCEIEIVRRELLREIGR
jgi:C-terminal processing protease CtpA/Prc